ncbi:MAG: hypothetical protein M3Y19_08690 [Actinomycetota bacterium]|nr:hypothetical protein [Actinomycetota bacterium]
MNNTARQAGGAIGIAAFGALAGTAAAGERFTHGFGAAGIATAVLFLVAAGVSVVLVPGHRRA